MLLKAGEWYSNAHKASGSYTLKLSIDPVKTDGLVDSFPF